MEADYIRILHALSVSGRATRPWCEVERVLASDCGHCPHWTLAGCSAMTPREFAAMLADATGHCPVECN